MVCGLQSLPLYVNCGPQGTFICSPRNIFSCSCGPWVDLSLRPLDLMLIFLVPCPSLLYVVVTISFLQSGVLTFGSYQLFISLHQYCSNLSILFMFLLFSWLVWLFSIVCAEIPSPLKRSPSFFFSPPKPNISLEVIRPTSFPGVNFTKILLPAFSLVDSWFFMINGIKHEVYK